MTLPTDVADMLDPILAVFNSRLRTVLQGHAVLAYLRGSAQMIEWGRTKLTNMPVYFEGPAMNQAISYAEKHCAQLVTRMAQETKDRLAQMISDGIENKRGIDGLARDIRREFDDMTKARSELIAKTETRDALFHASEDRMKDMGVTGKAWILGSGGAEGNCEACLANADAGPIPVEDDFPTPQYEIHPGCTCAISPVMLETREAVHAPSV